MVSGFGRPDRSVGCGARVPRLPESIPHPQRACVRGVCDEWRICSSRQTLSLEQVGYHALLIGVFDDQQGVVSEINSHSSRRPRAGPRR
jgi:hypothetical protein